MRWHRAKGALCKPRREASRETRPADTLILTSSLQNWEKINCYCLSLPDYGILLWQPEKTNTASMSRMGVLNGEWHCVMQDIWETGGGAVNSGGRQAWGAQELFHGQGQLKSGNLFQGPTQSSQYKIILHPYAFKISHGTFMSRRYLHIIT